MLPYSLLRMERTVTDLEKYVAYNITVLCFTAPGDGPRSRPIEIKTKEDGKDRDDSKERNRKNDEMNE